MNPSRFSHLEAKLINLMQRRRNRRNDQKKKHLGFQNFTVQLIIFTSVKLFSAF